MTSFLEHVIVHAHIIPHVKLSVSLHIIIPHYFKQFALVAQSVLHAIAPFGQDYVNHKLAIHYPKCQPPIHYA